ncbi:sulfotransferase [Temperatibacter marinus]|uniref:Sulfotransferase n=1 Tax=Temperatibacter marinus TaxID=1456591 RepID=A0AA52HAU6_9PROT|nr:sulfotransferase [Temperatibacter marinus]WND02978.1 sulfotransferase [Temperatibacter marinus]
MKIMTIMQQINGLIKERRISDAEKLAVSLTASYPAHLDGWVQRGRIAQMKGDYSGLLSCAQEVLHLDENHTVGRLQEIEALIHLSRPGDAFIRLESIEALAASNAVILQYVGQFYTQLAEYDSAFRVYNKSVELNPKDPQAHYNLSTAYSFTGDMVKAEACLDQVISLNPHDYDAYYNRATLRKQTKDNNHLEELNDLALKVSSQQQAMVPVHFALAKEYEDVGDYAQSISHLMVGTKARKGMLQYTVQSDVETMDSLKKHMNLDFCTDIKRKEGAGPIFILGMPRTGSTLVDRILASHSKVESIGEINDFAVAMMQVTGQVSSKDELVKRSTEADFPKLAQLYNELTASRRKKSPNLIDKTPANFLYIGLIAKALPTAKIIHIKRAPMDSCYAIYKTLFRMGYPFSYDMEDLAIYYASYVKLMDHWSSVLPSRIHEISYESLVTDQRAETEKLLAYCDLEWEENCINFHENRSASATASAAQVRMPMYQSSVNLWKRYEAALSPLKTKLNALGIDCGEIS